VSHQPADYPSRAWVELAPVTLLGIAASLGFAFLLNYLMLFSETLTAFDRNMITAVAVPVAIGAPLSFLLAWNFREARRYRKALTRAASYDRDTQFFNGNAFSSVVDRRTSTATMDHPEAALLVVNADNLRSINMRYGLEWGEEALRVVAATIRASVREGDIVGRLGPSEFGIFLPGASEESARDVGQRILDGIRQVYFMPAADEQLLSVSVGGVTFEGGFAFDGLYRAAEQQLPEAEGTGSIAISQMAKAPSSGETLQVAH
jgi:diguanylate cyclase